MVLIGYGLVGLSAVLLTLNVIGMLTAPSFPSAGEATRAERDPQTLLRKDSENPGAYAERLASDVRDVLAHAWPVEGGPGISPTENWLLSALELVGPVRDDVHRFEYVDYKRALGRGFGLCSQHALVVADVLTEQGFEAKVAALDGHVVATAELDGQEFVVDGDFGVAIPVPLARIERNPELVVPYYEDLAVGYTPFGTDEGGTTDAQLFADLYAPDNATFSSFEYKTLSTRLEVWGYRAKWLIPVLGLMLGAWLLYVASGRRAGS